MKTKAFILLCVSVLLLCGCGKTDAVSLESTSWVYENLMEIEFYADSTGIITVDDISLDFRYAINGDKINITCSDIRYAEDYGLDTLFVFGTSTFSVKRNSLTINGHTFTEKR